jgi:hypothetical protein
LGDDIIMSRDIIDKGQPEWQLKRGWRNLEGLTQNASFAIEFDSKNEHHEPVIVR